MKGWVSSSALLCRDRGLETIDVSGERVAGWFPLLSRANQEGAHERSIHLQDRRAREGDHVSLLFFLVHGLARWKKKKKMHPAKHLGVN